MASNPEPTISRETVMNLRSRLKHGENVTKILESQIDTAQQNISLLQGQVRLANETIINLKKHFQDTEKLLLQILSPETVSTDLNVDAKSDFTDVLNKQTSVDSTTRSPVTTEGSSSELNKGYDEKQDGGKSPYAQQLRQVLDVLTDEEPRKTVRYQHESNADCGCIDCHSPQKQFVDSKGDNSCGSNTCEHYTKKEDFCTLRHQPNGHAHENSQSKMFGEPSHRIPYSSQHCNGACCSPNDNYKLMEKSQSHHYMHSPPGHRGIEKNIPHYNDKCLTYVNYHQPYGYHVMDGSLHDSMASRRKRTSIALMAGEEPPHLKYTKVKRIDGNKLNAQKTLQDFTKRRFLPYNPRYDLDLLIVPPPIPAMELLKNNAKKPNELFQKSAKKDFKEANNNNSTAYNHGVFGSPLIKCFPTIKEEIMNETPKKIDAIMCKLRHDNQIVSTENNGVLLKEKLNTPMVAVHNHTT